MFSNLRQLQSKEYNAFRCYLKSICGIELGDNKQYLVETRIRKILIDYKLDSVEALLKALEDKKNIVLKQYVVDAMTTNETYWFRDSYPFVYLENVLLPSFQEQTGREHMRIWCSACSSGQEPYSVSMIVDEFQRSIFRRSCESEIVATDVSNAAISSAKLGIYDRISVVRGLSELRTQYYFEPLAGDLWKVKEKIRQRIFFRPLNLKDSYYLLGKFDVIFCRNVLIYFSEELRVDILTRMHASLNKDGILLLGSSENISGLKHLFRMVECKPGIAYQAI